VQHVQLRLGTSVASLVSQAGVTRVQLESGEALSARWVFDARPQPPAHHNTLVQQFAGWEVHAQHDAFDPDTVQLMAFAPHASGLHFWYVLPYSTRQALIESTWVSPASWQPDFTQELQNHLGRLLPANNYSITYREQGVLALTAPTHHKGPSYHPVALGRRGGTLRSSTGYAFLDSLAHAQRLAASLRAALRSNRLTDWQPQAFERPAAQTWMDEVFLNVLATDWMRAPQYFVQLFGRVPPDALVAFLSGYASPAQHLAVMRALPVGTFARAALRRMWAGRPR
jgi:lycopene beta-cyclase